MHHRQYQVSPRIVSTKAVETCSSDHCSFKFDFWRLLQAVSSHIIPFKRFQRCGFTWSGGQAQLIGNCQDQVSFSPITVEDIYNGNFLSGLNFSKTFTIFTHPKLFKITQCDLWWPKNVSYWPQMPFRNIKLSQNVCQHCTLDPFQVWRQLHLFSTYRRICKHGKVFWSNQLCRRKLFDFLPQFFQQHPQKKSEHSWSKECSCNTWFS